MSQIFFGQNFHEAAIVVEDGHRRAPPEAAIQYCGSWRFLAKMAIFIARIAKLGDTGVPNNRLSFIIV